MAPACAPKRRFCITVHSWPKAEGNTGVVRGQSGIDYSRPATVPDALDSCPTLPDNLGVDLCPGNGYTPRTEHAASHILADYTALQAASEIARFESMGAFQTAAPAGTTQAALINGCLSNIQKYVAAALASPAGGPGAAGTAGT
jgi:hypothetical protein